MNQRPPFDPESGVSLPARPPRLIDRYETGLAILVATWTGAFILRSRLALADRLTVVANEALLSLLFVVPIMLAGWGALVVADRRFNLGLTRSRE